MCTLSLYDVITITRHLHIKLKSFSNIAQTIHKEAVRGCSFLYIIAKKSVIMSEAFLLDVSIHSIMFFFCKHVNHEKLPASLRKQKKNKNCKKFFMGLEPSTLLSDSLSTTVILTAPSNHCNTSLVNRNNYMT